MEISVHVPTKFSYIILCKEIECVVEVKEEDRKRNRTYHENTI